MQNQLKQLKRKLNSSELYDEILRLANQAGQQPPEKKSNQNNKETFVSHCQKVGEILVAMNCSKETVVSGMLFGLKGNEIVLKNLSNSQQQEVSTIVEKAKHLEETYGYLKDLKSKTMKEWQETILDQQAENLRRSFFALSKDIRPILVLIADKLDELLRIVPHYPADQQKKQAIIALEIMAPLCYGLGITEFKGLFEDLAFPIIYPKEYKWLIENLKNRYEQTKTYTDKIQPQILKLIKSKNIIPVEISSRAKRYFSLYQKLLRHNMEIDKIYDLVAVRIIVQSVEDCYQTLSVLHKNFKPLPDRTKDYIANPKMNGYQAIHTTVFGPENKIVEIQIKTQQMHKDAEFGIAAHLNYKGKFSQKTYKYQFFWLDQLRKWRDQAKNIENVSQQIKTELFKDRIFVFTPKGDVVDLPKDATPIDFAFAIHSDVGEHASGALVNGKMVPFNEALKTNDRVEIITEKHKMPSAKWLRFVKTQKAKTKINNFLEKTYGVLPQSPVRAAVSTVGEKVSLIKKIIPAKLLGKPKILIAGEQGIAIKMGKCCHPKETDPITAFITQGEGASVHKATCPNLLELKQKWPERVIGASWQK